MMINSVNNSMAGQVNFGKKPKKNVDAQKPLSINESGTKKVRTALRVGLYGGIAVGLIKGIMSRAQGFKVILEKALKTGLGAGGALGIATYLVLLAAKSKAKPAQEGKPSDAPNTQEVKSEAA